MVGAMVIGIGIGIGGAKQIRHTAYIIHHTSYIIHHTSYIIHHTSYIKHHTSYITHHTSYIGLVCVSVGKNELYSEVVNSDGTAEASAIDEAATTGELAFTGTND